MSSCLWTHLRISSCLWTHLRISASSSSSSSSFYCQPWLRHHHHLLWKHHYIARCVCLCACIRATLCTHTQVSFHACRTNASRSNFSAPAGSATSNDTFSKPNRRSIFCVCARLSPRSARLDTNTGMAPRSRSRSPARIPAPCRGGCSVLDLLVFVFPSSMCGAGQESCASFARWGWFCATLAHRMLRITPSIAGCQCSEGSHACGERRRQRC